MRSLIRRFKNLIILCALVATQQALAVAVIVKGGAGIPGDGAPLAVTEITLSIGDLQVNPDELGNDGADLTLSFQDFDRSVLSLHNSASLRIRDVGPISIPTRDLQQNDRVVVSLPGSAYPPSPGPTPASAQRGTTIEVGGGAGNIETPMTGTAGLIIPAGGDETHVLFSPGDVDTTGFHFNAAFKLHPRFTLNFGGNQASGDRSAMAEIPTMTEETAIVVTDTFNGSTGVGGGLFFGMHSNLLMEVDQWQVNLGVHIPLSRGSRGGAPDPENDLREPPAGIWIPYFQLAVGNQETRIASTDTFNDPILSPSPISQRSQTIDENRYTFDAMLRYSRPLNNRVTWFLDGGLIFNYMDAQLSSTEDFTCFQCAPALIGTITRSDEKTGWSVGGAAGTGLTVSLTDRVAVGIRGYYRDGTETAALVNPSSGDDLFIDNMPSFLSTQKVSAYGGSLFFTVDVP